MENQIIRLLAFFSLQIILFAPFYFIWKKDCKEIGKANLAVSLQERFIVWIFICPIWLLGLLR